LQQGQTTLSVDGAILEERIASTQYQKHRLDFEDVGAGVSSSNCSGIQMKTYEKSQGRLHDAEATIAVPETY